jgi:hypothetical protein
MVRAFVGVDRDAARLWFGMFRRYIGGELRPVAHDDAAHLIADLIDHGEALDLAAKRLQILWRQHVPAEIFFCHRSLTSGLSLRFRSPGANAR